MRKPFPLFFLPRGAGGMSNLRGSVLLNKLRSQ